MRKVVIGAVVFLILFAGAIGAVFAEGKGCGKMGDHGKDKGSWLDMKAKMFLCCKDQIGLTKEQIKSIKDIVNESKKDRIMKDAEIDVIVVDLKSKMMEDTLDVDAINSLIDKKYEIKKAEAKAMVSSCAKLKNVLTDEQREKLRDLCSKRCKGKEKK